MLTLQIRGVEMELYGSLVNRIYESNYKDGKIEIGTGVTELGYSDRTPYYVVGINLYPKTSKYKGETRRNRLC